LDKERCHHAGAKDRTKRYIIHNDNDVAKTCSFLMLHVHIEFQLNSSSNKHRMERLLSFIARNGHPSSKFLRGNSIPLNNDINDDKLYEEVYKFKKHHYSAHRMTLAIQAIIMC